METAPPRRSYSTTLTRLLEVGGCVDGDRFSNFSLSIVDPLSAESGPCKCVSSGTGLGIAFLLRNDVARVDLGVFCIGSGPLNAIESLSNRAS